MMHDECMVGIGGTALHWSKAVRDVPDGAQLHPTVYERLAMASVRNFTTFGPYRPVALQQHKLAKKFFEPTSGADPRGDGTAERAPAAPPGGASA
jgi:hypothetical protein